VIYQPGVYVFDVAFPQGVPFVVEEPGFGAEDMRGQPLTVAEWYGPVLAAVQQQYRDRYLGHVETPRGELRDTVVPGPFDPGARACCTEIASSVSNARSVPGKPAWKSIATWAGAAARIFGGPEDFGLHPRSGTLLGRLHRPGPGPSAVTACVPPRPGMRPAAARIRTAAQVRNGRHGSAIRANSSGPGGASSW
jgi:hypothetical protein